MPNAVFTTKVNPTYDDLPELRYHFPRTYLNKVRECVGELVVYYEPRREGTADSGRSGRQCYFAVARVESVEEDPNRAEHFYARMTDYLEFDEPVPFRQADRYLESALQKEDGSTNKGQFGRSVRNLQPEEFQLICRLGFVSDQPDVVNAGYVLSEEPVPYGRPNRVEITSRKFRDSAFSRTIQRAYEKTCAMTGLKLVNGGGRCEIEAAHIIPVEEDGPDSPRNGIALSRTVHWLFDRGYLTISPNMEILVAESLVPPPVLRLLNPDRRLNIPQDPALRPHPVFLNSHRRKFKG